VRQHLVVARLFNVENLSLQREDRLETAIAPLLGGPTGGFALDVPFTATGLRELAKMDGAIIVDKDNHKAMVIGKGGEKLKQIGTQARIDMEKLFGGKVFLELWVQVKSGWADSLKALKSLGYE